MVRSLHGGIGIASLFNQQAQLWFLRQFAVFLGGFYHEIYVFFVLQYKYLRLVVHKTGTEKNTKLMSIAHYFEFQTYQETAAYLKSQLPPALQQVSVGIVCGSGLGGLASLLSEPIVECHYKVFNYLS